MLYLSWFDEAFFIGREINFWWKGKNACSSFSCWIFLKRGERFKMLTIKCTKKKEETGYKALSFRSFVQATAPFSLSLLCCQLLSRLWGILQRKVASQFSPIRLRISFSQFPQFYCCCFLSFSLSLLMYVLK